MDFELCPQRAARGKLGAPEARRKAEAGEGSAVTHLSLWGTWGCFWCRQAPFQGYPSALPEPAEMSHEVQGGAVEAARVQWGGEGGGMRGSHQLRLQLLHRVTENLRVLVPGWLGLWGGVSRLVTR